MSRNLSVAPLIVGTGEGHALLFHKRRSCRGREELPDVADGVAVEMARRLFDERKDEFDDFEVWEVTAQVHLFPEPLRDSA